MPPSATLWKETKIGFDIFKGQTKSEWHGKRLRVGIYGKQFSLEDSVLSRENYGQVVLPDVKEEPLSQATVEQMPIPPPNKEHQREVPREEEEEEEEEERQRGTNDSDTFAPRCEAEGRTNGRQQEASSISPRRKS